jgi:hypothetical protein
VAYLPQAGICFSQIRGVLGTALPAAAGTADSALAFLVTGNANLPIGVFAFAVELAAAACFFRRPGLTRGCRGQPGPRFSWEVRALLAAPQLATVSAPSPGVAAGLSSAPLTSIESGSR